MSNYYAIERSPDYLEHYGILGMKWGIRRFQNPDGSLTEEGRKSYGDILTKDQMNNMIKGYNLRTGSNKKITNKTIFKTDHGTYDSKGRRIDTDTEVKDPGNDKPKKTETKKQKVSDLSDKDLAALNDRMQQEITYIERYAKLHPQDKGTVQRMMDNLKESLIRDIPGGVSEGIKQYIATSIKNMANPQPEKKPTNDQQRQNSDKKPDSTPKPATSAVKEKVKEAVKETPRYDSRNSNAMDFFGTRFSDIGKDSTSTSSKETLDKMYPAVVKDTSMATLNDARLYGDLYEDILNFKKNR